MWSGVLESWDPNAEEGCAVPGVDLLKWVAAWLGLGSAVYVLFDRAEKTVTPATRKAISRWLQNLDYGEAVRNWPDAFAKVFDRVFGEKHLSWKCFLRSSVASLVAVSVMWLLVEARLEVIPDLCGDLLTNYLIPGVLASIALNLVPDYVSLLETRALLKLMAKSTVGVWSPSLVIVDVAATAVIFASALFLYELPHLEPELPSVTERVATAMQDAAVWWDLSRWEEGGGQYYGIYLYSTYFTSVWLWLYLLGGLALKAAYFLGLGVRGLGKVLDVKEQPLRSIGMVCNLGITVVFLVLLVL